MSDLILSQKDIFRAERLFSEGIAGSISSSVFIHSEKDRACRSISRMIDETKKFRMVRI